MGLALKREAIIESFNLDSISRQEIRVPSTQLQRENLWVVSFLQKKGKMMKKDPSKIERR